VISCGVFSQSPPRSFFCEVCRSAGRPRSRRRPPQRRPPVAPMSSYESAFSVDIWTSFKPGAQFGARGRGGRPPHRKLASVLAAPGRRADQRVCFAAGETPPSPGMGQASAPLRRASNHRAAPAPRTAAIGSDAMGGFDSSPTHRSYAPCRLSRKALYVRTFRPTNAWDYGFRRCTLTRSSRTSSARSLSLTCHPLQKLQVFPRRSSAENQ